MSNFYDDERPPPAPTTEGVRILGAEEARAGLENHESESDPPDDPRFAFDDEPAADDSAITESPDEHAHERPEGDLPTGDVPPLPHWTEPATGAVPAIFADDSDQPADELDAWATVTGAQPRFRAEGSDWAASDFAEDLSGEHQKLGALSNAGPVDEE
ncbi:MAG: phosphatidate cytidylyltransferase [Actinomycetota bacterium]|nr:phosphatidate cytidylyltransferase [Actinomycetota bacterium]